MTKLKRVSKKRENITSRRAKTMARQKARPPKMAEAKEALPLPPSKFEEKFRPLNRVEKEIPYGQKTKGQKMLEKKKAAHPPAEEKPQPVKTALKHPPVPEKTLKAPPLCECGKEALPESYQCWACVHRA